MQDDDYWDGPFRVENEQLHKALTELFTALKNDGSYTRRDLVYVRPHFNDYPDLDSCCIYFSYDKNEICNYPNGAKMQRLFDVSIKGSTLGKIPQSDLDLFIMSKYIKHL